MVINHLVNGMILQVAYKPSICHDCILRFRPTRISGQLLRSLNNSFCVAVKFDRSLPLKMSGFFHTHTIHGHGVFTYVWLFFMVYHINVGKYTIHGCCGIGSNGVRGGISRLILCYSYFTPCLVPNQRATKNMPAAKRLNPSKSGWCEPPSPCCSFVPHLVGKMVIQTAHVAHH